MILKTFSVWDLKALCFGVPFFMPSTGAAVRAFSDLANDKQSMVARHPSDYLLFQIGEFDDSKGVLIPFDKHVHLGLASDFIERVTAVVGPGAFPSVNEIREVVESAKNGGSK